MKEDEEILDPQDEGTDNADEAVASSNGYVPHNDDAVGEDKVHHLGGMFQNSTMRRMSSWSVPCLILPMA